MYEQHFHFNQLPFSISPDPHFMYMSARHQEGLAHLLYGIDFGGGFVALTGEVGTGKTTLCHCLLQQLPKNIDMALILNSRLNAFELVATICDELGVTYDKTQLSLKYLIDNLNQYLLSAHAQGRRTVLLIDEAQNLSMDVLEQIRLLTNLETSTTKLLRIILVGQPELKELLAKRELRQLNQRITARYHLLPLSFEETSAYIEHRLSVCHGQVDIFNAKALRRVYRLTEGIPRLINILCDRALLGAYSKHSKTVNASIVNMAAKEVLPGPIELNLPYIRISLAIFSVALINYGLFFINKEPTESLKVVNAKTIESPYEQLQTIKPTPQVVRPSEINRVTSTESLNISPTPTIFNPPTAFEQWLNNPDYFLDYYPDYSLDSALITLLRHWGKEIPETGKVDCHSIVAMGLRCVYGKTTWRELLLIKRPVILEFSLNNSKKQHALVTGYRQKTAEIEFKENIKFPLADVLKYWEGYYLALEAPVMPTAKGILQGQSSDNVLWLRNVLNNIDGKSPIVQDPTYYDEALAQRVLKFQEQFHLKKDSRVEGDTLLRLKQFVHNFQSSHLKISD